ncbi:MAG: hypothetical protein WBE98_06295, partial [Gammaproteobacteria bacterium]
RQGRRATQRHMDVLERSREGLSHRARVPAVRRTAVLRRQMRNARFVGQIRKPPSISSTRPFM